mmetsp:Transcript_101672/g.323012  ORF Transcript_101672/g.323012 Transcript_101672/m.323012 type:complete len:477 (-) Transcript_101672:18-1448(-)
MMSRNSFSGASGSRAPVSRARSSTLRRAGTSVSADLLGSSGGFSTASLQDSAPLLQNPPTGHGDLLSAAAAEPHDSPVAHVTSEEPCGLTPASLKHLKRKYEVVLEEKARLQSEISGLQAQVREQRQRVSVLEEEVREAEVRQRALQEEVQRAQAAEEAQRSRADELERCNEKLEELLAAREAELARLREALEQQRRLTREVCEASERRTEAPPPVDASKFEQRIKSLEAERGALQQQLRDQALEQEDMKRAVAGAMGAAEKAMAMHALHVQRLEAMRVAKLMEAINYKVELHISVPRVTLTYNNAPPLVVSTALGLSDGKIRDFLDRDVFPHFEPLWVRIDALDQAPDGSTKRTYCTKMLERLTDAVKAFIMKSQTAEAGADLNISSTNSPAQGPAGGGAGRAGPVVQTATSAIADGVSRRASGAEAGRGGGSGGGGTNLNDLSDADRAQLLQLLRSGDDRGLDGKLVQMLAGRS